MPRKVRTEVANVTLPGVGRIDAPLTVITLTDYDFSLIPAAAFTNGKVTDLGFSGPSGDVVNIQGAYVAPVGALTSSQNATANGSDAATTQALANALKVSYNALQADVAAIRTTLNAELTALQGTNKPQASS